MIAPLVGRSTLTLRRSFVAQYSLVADMKSIEVLERDYPENAACFVVHDLENISWMHFSGFANMQGV